MRAGIDDFGSGEFTGYSCIVISDQAAGHLNERGKQILDEAGIEEFHGKDFDPSEREPYRAFVEAIREALVTHGGQAAFQLVHHSTFTEIFVRHAGKVADGVLEQLRGRPHPFVRAKMGGLFAFGRVLVELPAESVVVEMDWGAPGDVEAAREVLGVMGQGAALLEDAARVAARIADARFQAMKSGAPRLREVHVVDSSDSILVQAADVIANFGTNYVKSHLRDEDSPGSAKESTKAEIFEGLLPEDTEFRAPDSFKTSDANVIVGEPEHTLRFDIGA